MKKSIIILQIMFAVAIFVASCRKADVNMTSGAITPTQPPPPPPDSLTLYSWYNYDGSGTGLWAIDGFGDVFNNVVSKFDSTYYNDHVKVHLKFADSTSWKNIRYVAHDHSGQNNLDVYFTDDNYYINFPPPLSAHVVVPRIIVLAKPTALIDFTKQVAVKIVVN